MVYDKPWELLGRQMQRSQGQLQTHCRWPIVMGIHSQFGVRIQALEAGSHLGLAHVETGSFSSVLEAAREMARLLPHPWP